jgi:hypothetical protein
MSNRRTVKPAKETDVLADPQIAAETLVVNRWPAFARSVRNPCRSAQLCGYDEASCDFARAPSSSMSGQRYLNWPMAVWLRLISALRWHRPKYSSRSVPGRPDVALSQSSVECSCEGNWEQNGNTVANAGATYLQCNRNVVVFHLSPREDFATYPKRVCNVK